MLVPSCVSGALWVAQEQYEGDDAVRDHDQLPQYGPVEPNESWVMMMSEDDDFNENECRRITELKQEIMIYLIELYKCNKKLIRSNS